MIYTRLRFCPQCAEACRPHVGDWYLNLNGDDKQFLQVTTHVHKDGFGVVPHQIELINQIGREIAYRSVCGMDHCGIEMVRDEKGNLKVFNSKNEQIIVEDGVSYANVRGILVPQDPEEDFYHHSKRIKQPTPGMCTRAAWGALLKYDEKI